MRTVEQGKKVMHTTHGCVLKYSLFFNDIVALWLNDEKRKKFANLIHLICFH